MSFEIAKPLSIVEAGRLDDQTIAVTFSDGTSASYKVEQLSNLTPERRATEQQKFQSGEPFDGYL